MWTRGASQLLLLLLLLLAKTLLPRGMAATLLPGMMLCNSAEGPCADGAVAAAEMPSLGTAHFKMLVL
jgi:hypothetical protein